MPTPASNTREGHNHRVGDNVCTLLAMIFVVVFQHHIDWYRSALRRFQLTERWARFSVAAATKLRRVVAFKA